jgi:hypothetical protein
MAKHNVERERNDGARMTKTRSLEIGHLVIDFGFRHSLASPLAS